MKATSWKKYNEHSNDLKTKTMKRIFKNLLSKTPRQHKIDGRFATAFAFALQTISMSGIVDNRPLIKTALDIATGLLTKKAFDHGIQTETEPNIEENGN